MTSTPAPRLLPRRRALLGLLALTLLALPTTALANRADFSGPVQWQAWPVALKTAKATGKPICLVVYAHWCPHCRSLAPAFRDPEVVKLAKGLVMVHQDSDEKPAWLADVVGKYGSYVPRVFFLRPDGTVAEEITSGHARFPYFYQFSKLPALRDSMARASKTLGGKKRG